MIFLLKAFNLASALNPNFVAQVKVGSGDNTANVGYIDNVIVTQNE